MPPARQPPDIRLYIGNERHATVRKVCPARVRLRITQGCSVDQRDDLINCESPSRARFPFCAWPKQFSASLEIQYR
jgi:hypothetical protein